MNDNDHKQCPEQPCTRCAVPDGDEDWLAEAQAAYWQEVDQMQMPPQTDEDAGA